MHWRLGNLDVTFIISRLLQIRNELNFLVLKFLQKIEECINVLIFRVHLDKGHKSYVFLYTRGLDFNLRCQL